MESNRQSANGSAPPTKPPDDTAVASISPSITPRHRPTFAQPLLQPARSEKLQWRLPKPFHHHQLIGCSRAAWHTSFLVPSLNLVLDAGLIIDNSRPQNVFITHGHSDHSYHVLTYCRRIAVPDIYVPAQTAKFLDDYIMSGKCLNLGVACKSYHNFDADGNKLPDTSLPRIDGDEDGDGNAADTDDEGEGESEGEGHVLMPTHNIIPVNPDSPTTYPLKTNPSVLVSILPRHHTVPSVGFLFTQTSNRLKPAYRTLPGQQIKQLRETGVEITYLHHSPILAFLGDGDHTSLLDDPEWLVGNEEKGISHCPVVITECSFLVERHRRQAHKTRHTLWANLEPLVRRHPRTTWVLIHFSKRYSASEIVAFFEALADREEGCPPNIVVWVDAGGELAPAGQGAKGKG
ncbi:hypothetical protein Dda_1191 [Drechslerella dactyloides]|uniref:Metallo-beta-lactamase domain-containing protein n=1 Tax=Drechslerella dactyloides TaxID=74499 RepID=A0AAD6J8P0_DREDA|nr:hypothetical protein Dda_1191 [Drechslerella dactyloides]